MQLNATAADEDDVDDLLVVVIEGLIFCRRITVCSCVSAECNIQHSTAWMAIWRVNSRGR